MSKTPALKESPDRVLSTMNKDGSRRWLRPKLSQGFYLRWRRVVAYLLMAFFILIPYGKINNKPLILLDIPKREFSFFGTTFIATETIFLYLFLLAVFLFVFWITALFGRVWCGWGCPQTVYLEFVFRPLERWIEGNANQQKKIDEAGIHWKRILKWFVFLMVSSFLAHVFLAYFVGIDSLKIWLTQSPFLHPFPFLFMSAVTALILFNFGYFREQTCTVACPYGRLQSVLLDKDSLIVAYDVDRGEPRGKRKKGEEVTESKGDCIDCNACVLTCPTGIDIREGLQMECINCTQCMDACDAIMTKIQKPLQLIRYSSQNAIEKKETKKLRLRTILYPVLMGIVLSLFALALFSREKAELVLLRGDQAGYSVEEGNRIRNYIKVTVYNHTSQKMTFQIEVEKQKGLQIRLPLKSIVLEGSKVGFVPLFVTVSEKAFKDKKPQVRVSIVDKDKKKISKVFQLLGPY